MLFIAIAENQNITDRAQERQATNFVLAWSTPGSCSQNTAADLGLFENTCPEEVRENKEKEPIPQRCSTRLPVYLHRDPNR